MKQLTLALIACACFAQSPSYHPVASTKQIMAAIEKPAMDRLSEMAKTGGPKDDAEWATARQSAAILAESTQLLLMGSRPKDQELWIASSQRLVDAASDSAKLAESKDLEGWKTSLKTISAQCRSCHEVHRKRQPATN